MSEQSEDLASLNQAPAASDRASLNQIREVSNALDDVLKQLAKFGREQFKLNTLVETQQRQMQVALERLGENDARRDRDRSTWLAGREEALARARLEIVQRILPALDGLDEAIASLERAANTPHPSLIRRLFSSTPGRANRDEQIVAWRNGLIIVRDRLLAVLAEEGVQPIETRAQSFDPTIHVALQHAPAGANHPAGTIVREVRRGYIAGEDILRYAEVVVAK